MWTTRQAFDQMSSERQHEVVDGLSPDGTRYDLLGQGHKPVIALIHGLGLSRQLWNDHLPDFLRHYRVLNYDLYGHGSTAALPASSASTTTAATENGTRQATLSDYSNQLAALLAHLQLGPAAVVGFSIGGMINRRFALDYPQRVAALAILNSPHNRGDLLQQQVEERAAKVRGQGAMSTMPDALKRWFTPDFLGDFSVQSMLASRSGEVVDQAKHAGSSNQLLGAPAKVCQWRQQVDAVSYAAAAWVLANGVRELINPQPAINTPTLVITCENDTGSTVAMSEAITREISGAQLLIVPELQHLGLMENPKAFTQPVIDFLNRELT